MKENVLFIFPTTMEEALWAVTDISQYLENRLVMTKEIRDSVTGFTVPARRSLDRVAVVCPLVEIHPILKACWNKIEVATEVTDELKEMADLVIEFDTKISYELTKDVKKHITEALGFQLGSVPLMILPAIAQKIVREDLGSILVVGRYYQDEKRDWIWPHQDEFIEMGCKNGLDIKVSCNSESFDELARTVSRASVVVGVRSTGTLLASCFRKVVMELYPEGVEHKEWMSKWENKAYRMIHGDLNDMAAWFVWDRTNKLVAELAKIRGPELCMTHSSSPT